MVEEDRQSSGRQDGGGDQQAPQRLEGGCGQLRRDGRADEEAGDHRAAGRPGGGSLNRHGSVREDAEELQRLGQFSDGDLVLADG